MLLDVKSTFREVDTLLPVIFMSGGTSLSNFAGNKKECPLNMTIGNQSTNICQMPLTCRIVMVALLTIQLKNRNIPLHRVDQQQQSNREPCTKYSGGYSWVSHLNNIPVLRESITMFSVQMATSGVANRFQQQGLQIAQSIVTYIISSSMSGFGMSVHRLNFKIMSLLTNNTLVWITTYIERSAMPTTRQPMTNTHRGMFSQDSNCLDIFPVLGTTSRSLTFSVQCSSACLTTCRSGFSISVRRTNGSPSTMQSVYAYLVSTTSHQDISLISKCLNGMGRRWRKWAGTWLEL